ncbi:MAG: YggS family pyridoxal phosphate-dependent enzyme [Cyclobacteriaceae bacterium]
MSIQENLLGLAKEIPHACTLIVVSKTQPLEKIQEAYDAGHRDFGENKVQEMAPKYEVLPKDISWHLIGHLQTNKVKYIAPFVSLIHSVDSPKLLVEINKQASKISRIIPCLLQIHIAGEETKFGFSEQEVLELVHSTSLEGLQNIAIKGLMGMATFTDNKDQVRREFKSLRMLFEKLKNQVLPGSVKMEELSMGMSGDFTIALEEGSTMIRVGTAIFGQRKHP